MKEMIYKLGHEFEILHQEKKGDYNIAIISYGTHPCAYISIPPTHPYYKKEYDEVNISCHFGLTFSDIDGSRAWWAKDMKEDCSWIGWDYGHCDDYVGYYADPRFKHLYKDLSTHKKWTTQEILEECYDVVEQLERAK